MISKRNKKSEFIILNTLQSYQGYSMVIKETGSLFS